MKTCLLILIAVTVTYCLPADFYKPEWEKFKKQYNRNYSPDEEEFRFKLFCKTLDIIRKHNEDYAKGLTTFKMGVNQFADLTPEEKQKWLGVHSLYGENEEVKSTYLPVAVYQEEWEKFKKQYNRNYSPEEEEFRFKLFCKTLDIIRKHNEDYEKGLTTFKMGVNQFADLTPEEKQKWLGLHSLYAGNDEVKSTYLSAEVYHEEWEKFKNIYKKLYDSPEEEKRRFEIFCENLDKIRHHNELYDKGLVTYKMGINKYADVTPEEFENMMGLKPKEQGLNQGPYEDCEVEWQKFKKQFNRHYSAEEEQFRYKLFCKTLAIITKHNEDCDKGLTTYKMGMNQFADLTPEEKQKWLGTHVLYGENENVRSTHLTKEVYQEEWQRFKSTYKKLYDTPEEEKHRFEIFCKNLDEIYHHNELYAKGLVTYEMGVNKFTDLTYEELAKMMGFKSKERELYQELSYDFRAEWEKFKKRFNKHYEAGEERHRFEIFSENLREIIKHNEDYEKGLSDFRMGITRFTDMTKQEYLKFLEEEAGGVIFTPSHH